MKNLFLRIRGFTTRHKIISVIIVLALVYIGYKSYQKLFSTSGETRYVAETVSRGMLVVSLSGSGQVSASRQIDIKPKVSGDIVRVLVKGGQKVNAGTLVAEIDSKDAQKTVRDAQSSLDSAKITLEKLKGPEGLSVPRNKTQAADTLAKAYDDGFSSTANAFIDLPSLLTNFKNLLQNKTFDKSQDNVSWYANQIPYDEEIDKRHAEELRDATRAGYDSARAAYDKTFDLYKSTTRISPAENIESLILQTYTTTQLVADAVKVAGNYIDFVRNFMEENNYSISSSISTQQSSLYSYTGTLNGHLTKLLSSSNSIKDAKDAYTDADLDLASQKLSLKQKENSLKDAQEKLADYFVRAPFSGVIGKVDSKVGDSASSGTSLATLVTFDKFAEISLNEIDAAKIKEGQKVSLTFDAVPDLTLTGKVTETDTVGAVSQGVVTYTIKIGFDTQDDRVKTAMSVTTSIITDEKQDVLLVPNSAVKTQNNSSYVEVFDSSDVESAKSAGSSGVVPSVAPKRVAVQTGLTNDDSTEIISGLKEGDVIVARTIQSVTTTATTNSQSSAIKIPGIGGNSGGARNGNFGR